MCWTSLHTPSPDGTPLSPGTQPQSFVCVYGCTSVISVRFALLSNQIGLLEPSFSVCSASVVACSRY